MPIKKQSELLKQCVLYIRGVYNGTRHPRCYPQQCFKRTVTTTTLYDDSYIFRSPCQNVDIPDTSFAEFMFSRYKRHPPHLTALHDIPSGRNYTFQDLMDAAVRVASGLTKMGIKQGDRILMFTTNCPEYLLILLACGATGVVLTTANPTYTSGELKRQLEHSRSCMVITLPGFIETVQQAISTSQTLTQQVKHIMTIGDSNGFRPFRTLLEDDGNAFPDNVNISSNDLLVIPYSSGTTGLPKGVMLSHRNIISNILQASESLKLVPGEDRLLGILPLFHIYGMVISQFSSTAQGASFWTMPRFIPKDFLSAIQKHKMTYLNLVPPLLLFLAKDTEVPKYDISSVHSILCGAAPLGEQLSKHLKQRTSATLLQAYGLTETGPLVCCDLPPGRTGTSGFLVANTLGKIVDVETGEILPVGQAGEVCAKGPQRMLGYLDNQQATDDMIKDGWVHSGDIGYFSEDGRLTVTDRLKELIKYKGFQVAPAELEALLLSNPAVQDVAVAGVPDEEAGELPKAFVVLKPGKTSNPEQIAQFVKENVSLHKQLRGGVQIVNNIPKTPSGKILRRYLTKDM